MSAVLSSILSEFETVEQEDSYSVWLRSKVAASLADQRPSIPHDEVMAEADAIISDVESTTLRSA